MQEKIIEELRQELKAQTDENQELLKINEKHKKINGELRKENDALITIFALVREYIKDYFYIDKETGEYYLTHTFGSSNLYELSKILERVNEE